MSQVSEKTLREPRHVVEVTGSKMIIAAGGQNSYSSVSLAKTNEKPGCRKERERERQADPKTDTDRMRMDWTQAAGQRWSRSRSPGPSVIKVNSLLFDCN